MESIWRETQHIPPYPPLDGDCKAQAVVIGGGMAGLLTAWQLGLRGISAIVLESGRIGGGVTGNTTAKITAQHGLCYDKLIRQCGQTLAQQYAQANSQAVGQYGQLVRELGIDCDFQEIDAYLYATVNPAPLERELNAVQRLGIDASLSARTELPMPVKGALAFHHQAQFHPLKFLARLAEELTIYEQTKVLAVGANRVHTDRGVVEADAIVVATHFPFVNKPGYYFMRMHQERSYVLALEGAATIRNAYIGIDGDSWSIRGYNGMVLLGGANHRTGENKSGGKYGKLSKAAAALWPDSREVCRWSAQDCMPHDGIPYIGRYSKTRNNLYVATGFHKWGMTGSMVAANLLAQQISGETPDWQVFSPQRKNFMSSAKGLARDGFISAQGLINQVFTLPEDHLDDIAPGQAGIIEHEGDKVGAYRDEEGHVHLVSVLCPHLGCQLTWNRDEKTWDCPCHGSRFDHRGVLLDTPAQTNLEGNQ